MRGLRTGSVASLLAARGRAAAQAKPGRWELGVLFVVLILFSEGILPRLLASEQSADGSPVLRLMWLPV